MKIEFDPERLVERGSELVFTAMKLRDVCQWQAKVYKREGDDEGMRLQLFAAAIADDLIAYVTRRKVVRRRNKK